MVSKQVPYETVSRTTLRVCGVDGRMTHWPKESKRIKDYITSFDKVSAFRYDITLCMGVSFNL